MWKGRFNTGTAGLLKKYSESISFDWRLYRHDIAGSIAHSCALLEAGLITAGEQKEIAEGLLQIQDEIARGEFSFDESLEDIHMNIESTLTKRIGAAGAKLHTARSRNDQVALDLRLYLREETGTILNLVRELQRALVTLGVRHAEVMIPGYTHLQRAQPVLFAHHLLAYVEMLQRDTGRFADAEKRINVMPLGSGAIAGSTINLNRDLIAKLLDFPEITRNSMDAVSDRDFACELLAAIAITGMHLSRLSEDLILWASSEFRFITISDAFTTGSSLMPQKKNPDVAELTRGKTGRLYGNLFSLLTTLKGLPMTYNRDMQEDKEPVFDSVDTIKAALEVFAAMVYEIELPSCEGRVGLVSDPLLLATDLADYLVKKGVPFREAHECVGKAVRISEQAGCGLNQLPIGRFREINAAFENDLYAVFDPVKALAARTNPGAPSPANVAAQLKKWQESLGATKE